MNSLEPKQFLTMTMNEIRIPKRMSAKLAILASLTINDAARFIRNIHRKRQQIPPNSSPQRPFSKNHVPTLRFQAWIEQVYGFTMDSLRRWEVMPNSKHYLLGFWAAMVSPVILLQASWGPEMEGEYFGLYGVVYKNKNHHLEAFFGVDGSKLYHMS